MSWTFEAIGTVWQIELPELAPGALQNIQQNITERIAIFDAQYSRFRDDSLIARMAREAGTYTLPADAQPLFDLYQSLYKITNGKFTPLIGQVLSDAGYDASYSLKPKELHAAKAWDEVLDYDFPTLTLKEPALLDLGAAGKGYLVDIVAALIEAAGITTYVINAGGDVRVRSEEPVRIGLEHPEYPEQVIGVVSIAQGSLCGSAGNRRTWDKFTHIIDPDELTSPKHLKAAWVNAENALLADALTTCLFFTPAAELAKAYTFEYLLVYEDLAFEQSAGFPANLYTE